MTTQEIGLGARLRRLLELLDGDLEAIYAETVPGYRPRYTPVMKALAQGTPLTIKAISEISGVSHSAASQTVGRMMTVSLLVAQAGTDARERLIGLSDEGQALLPVLRRQWARTDQAARMLEAEIGAPLADVIGSATAALEARSFRDRILNP